MNKRKALIVVAEDWSFLSHRLPLARAMRDNGFNVTVACRVNQHKESIEAEGFQLLPLDLNRETLSPLNAIKTVRELSALYHQEKPDVIVHVSLMLSFLGGLAGFFNKQFRSVDMITGLGYVFISQSKKARLIRLIVKTCFRFFSKFNKSIIVVQNDDDKALFHSLGYTPDKTLKKVVGSGVDHTHFHPAKTEPAPQITFVGRILWAKGVEELIEAARILKTKNKLPPIVLVGDMDPGNPQSATPEDIQRWTEDKLVEFWGKRSDIADIYRQSTIAILPSWREGLPKSLLEAAACGLPMIATDVPGCRELVHHRHNGLLVPLKNATEIANAIEELMENANLRKQFGENARQRVDEELNDQTIAKQTLDVVTGALAL